MNIPQPAHARVVLLARLLRTSAIAHANGSFTAPWRVHG